jgi:5-dehydro-2-deoxygluconokinase
MDLYPIPDGSTIETAKSFVSDVGGSAGNIAAALARQGGVAALLSAFSDDSIGRFVESALTDYGVDTAYCLYLDGLQRTSLALAESRVDNPSVVIYRNDAADLAITPAQIDALDLNTIGTVIITGTALSREPSRSACDRLVNTTQDSGCPLVLDIDYRPQAWESLDIASQVLAQMAYRADMVVANQEEFDVVAGGNGRELAENLAGQGVLVLYKMGRGGCDILVADTATHIGIFEVEVLKPFGAGDAFLGGVMAGLGMGLSIEEAVQRGAAAAAMVVSRRGCASAMPSRAELDDFIVGHGSF